MVVSFSISEISVLYIYSIYRDYQTSTSTCDAPGMRAWPQNCKCVTVSAIVYCSKGPRFDILNLKYTFKLKK